MQDINIKTKTCLQCEKKKDINDFYSKFRGICIKCYNLRRSNNKSLRKKDKQLNSRLGKLNSDIQDHIKIVYEEYVTPPKINEILMEIPDEYCSHFGCGRKLKLHEKLAGKKCINHMIKTNKLIHTGLI